MDEETIQENADTPATTADGQTDAPAMYQSLLPAEGDESSVQPDLFLASRPPRNLFFPEENFQI